MHDEAFGGRAPPEPLGAPSATHALAGFRGGAPDGAGIGGEDGTHNFCRQIAATGLST